MTKSAPVLSQNQRNFQKEFFPSTIREQRKVTESQKQEEEKIVQGFLAELTTYKSFHIQAERKLQQPGSEELVPDAIAESFLKRHELSRQIAAAIVDQQILLKTNFSRAPLKKKIIPSLPPLQPKKQKRKVKPNLEKNLITNLVISNMKQQQGQQSQSLPGMGVAKFPPLFFSDDGSPLTNTGKSTYKSVLLKRYGENDFTHVGVTDHDLAVIIDGMPTLFLAPVLGLKTFGNYVNFLLKRKVLCHLQESKEIHVVFDKPGIWGFNLKKKVQNERDSKQKEVATLPEEIIKDETRIPCSTSQWPGFLANRENKRKLIQYIGTKIFALKEILDEGEVIILGGHGPTNTTYKVEKGSVSLIPQLACNHEEADTQIFAHANFTSLSAIRIVAADTDVFAILLLNFHHFQDKKISLDQGGNAKVTDMNALVQAMQADKDQDLMVLKQRGHLSLPFFFGLVHPLIGSDILCSPRSFGPAWILKTCIDLSEHIFHPEKGVQNLLEEQPELEGYTRYILSLYKKKFSNKIKMTAREMFAESANLNNALEQARQDTWVYTLENNTVLPSQDCLNQRGLNLAYQLKVWTQATKPQIDVPDPLQHGWQAGEDGYQLVPDSKENMAKQAELFDTVMKKCKCKKSQCKNGRCRCFASKGKCSTFCECSNCCNPFADDAQRPQEESDSEDESDVEEQEEEDHVETSDDE